MPSKKRRFERTPVSLTPVFITVLALLLLLTGSALARAGGGQSYGGGRSSGGDGGGDGLGFLVYFLIRLCIEQPCIGIPLTTAVIIALIVYNKKRKKMQEKYIARTSAARREAAASRGATDLALLKTADPGFTEAGFETMVRTAFTAIQSAWSRQDLSPVRAYISDGVRERFNLQFEMQRAMGYRNKMEGLEVLGVRVAGAHLDTGFQTVHVEIHARAEDTDVSLSDGRKLRTNATGEFHEYWTFLRRPGARTPGKGGIVQGFCPNCGASLDISDAGKCNYCGAHITSGAYDWILTEITQESEWKPAASPGTVPGLVEMTGKDPGFNLQPLSDTASVVFWRYVSSYFEGSTDPMAKVASTSFLPILKRNINQTAEGDWHLYFHDAAVGSVDVLEILPGTDMDRVRVLVKWSAWSRYRNGSGQVKGAGDRSIRPQVFTLARLPEVATRKEHDFHSAHCPGCGAPYSGGSSGSCEYCGRPLNDGSGAWILEDISAFSASMLRSRAGAPAADPEMVLMAMVATMFADGTPGEEERTLLDAFAAGRGIRRESVAAMVAAFEQGAGVPGAKDGTEAKAVLSEMVGMALADGTICPEEMKFLESYTTGAGLSNADLRTVIAGKRRTLYREAKRPTAG
ncbi:MAG: TIM44-like domain-containing protein [Candidatus Fermentibacteraceae bacterium]